MKDYHAHIAHPHSEHFGKSLCGVDIVAQFHFGSLDHAFLTIPSDRLQPCPECTAIVIEAFQSAE